MTQGFLLFLAFLTVLCFPSANLQLFDGLPVSRLPEFAALAVALPFLLFSELRVRQAAFWEKWKIHPAHLGLLLGAALIVKVALFASGAYAGFSGCYRSGAEPTGISHEDLPAMECERSYENLFGRYPGTRLDQTIRFGPDVWNLVFLNTSRYNYYEWDPGNILRPRIPIFARWNGYPDVGPGEPVRIEYVGEGSVVWGSVRAALTPSYEKTNVVEIDPPGAEAPLQINYSFDDGSRSGQDEQRWGPKATIRVASGTSESMSPLEARPAAVGFRGLALLGDAMILLWLAACLPALWHAVRHDLPALIATAVVIGCFTFAPIAPTFRGIGITIALAAALGFHIAVRPFRAASLYWLAVAAALAVLRVWAASGFGLVLLRSAGNDALSYESQAYSILATASLRGGESVFFYIPGYRYVKFLEHVLFGDGDMLYAAAQLAVFFGGVFLLFRGVERREIPAIKKILLAGLGAAMIFLGGYYVSGVIREGLSEYPTWILLLWALPGLMGPAPAGVIAAGAAALAVAYTIRPNQATGILWIFFLAAVGSWKKHFRTILLAGILALAIALLPLAHNLFFGREWMLTASSGGMSINLVLPPETWLAFLQGDGAAAGIVRQQMGLLILITDAPRSMLPTLAAMGACLLGWLAVSGWALARRKGPDLAWLAVPVFFLAVHLVYGVSTYYPRHIVIAYLSMGAVAVLVLVRGLLPKSAAVGPAVESPQA